MCIYVHDHETGFFFFFLAKVYGYRSECRRGNKTGSKQRRQRWKVPSPCLIYTRSRFGVCTHTLARVRARARVFRCTFEFGAPPFDSTSRDLYCQRKGVAIKPRIVCTCNCPLPFSFFIFLVTLHSFCCVCGCQLLSFKTVFIAQTGTFSQDLFFAEERAPCRSAFF